MVRIKIYLDPHGVLECAVSGNWF